MIFLTLLFYFTLLALSGSILSHKLFRRADPVFIIGSGMLLGPLGLLFTTGLLSYLFKGFYAQTLIFYSYVLVISFLGIRSLKKKSIIGIFHQFKKTTNIILSVVIFLYITVFFLNTSYFSLGGDVDIYFGIATSFARGNYPIHLPWQPIFLSGYHSGVFMVEGVLYALNQISIYSIHSFFSAYIISSLFLLITGLARIYSKSPITLFPAILGVVIFGFPVFLVGGATQFLRNLLNLHDLITYPQLVDFKGSLGGGSGDFFGMIYRNFYPFGLATFILSVYCLAVHNWKGRFFLKYVLIIILLVLTASIDESFFIIEVLISGFFFIKDVKTVTLQKIIRLLPVLAFTLIALILLIQNTVRDSILDPSTEGTRFKVLIPTLNARKSIYPDKFTLIPGDQEFMQYFNSVDDFGNGKSITGKIPISYLMKNLSLFNSAVKKAGSTNWLFPNLILLTTGLVILSLLFRLRISLIFSASALLTILLSVFIVYTFFPPTSVRFISQASQFLSLGIGFMAVELLGQNGKKLINTLIILLFIVSAPQIISAHARLLSLNQDIGVNFRPSSLSYQKALSKLQKLLPYNSRIILLDNFPTESHSSGITSEAIPRFGFFVPISPPDFKSVNSDASTEWIDAVNLNPPSLKILGVNYIFIQDNAKNRLRLLGFENINPDYFKFIWGDDTGKLYKVSDEYKNLPTQPNSIQKLTESIPKGSKVYLDKFELNELRRGLVLRLAKKTKMLGPGLSAGGDYFMYIETFTPFTYICEAPYLPKCGPAIIANFEPIDYIITEPKKDIKDITNSPFNKYFSAPLVTVWERI